MTTPNPLVPQGTFPEKGKSHVRIAVFTILAIHVVLLGALLIAGCKKTGDAVSGDGATNANIGAPPPFEPPPPLTPTNPPAPASNLASPTPYVPPTPVTPPPPPESTPGMTEHTIVKGDTFATLGPKYHVGWQAIVEANPGVDPTRLKLGQKIKIPPPRTRATPDASNGLPHASNGGSEKTYVVKSGDNLMKIANANGISLRALRAANRLKTDQIKVGQKLVIPAKTAPSPETAPAPFSPPPGPTNP